MAENKPSTEAAAALGYHMKWTDKAITAFVLIQIALDAGMLVTFAQIALRFH
jgi:hypothetical protein